MKLICMTNNKLLSVAKIRVNGYFQYKEIKKFSGSYFKVPILKLNATLLQIFNLAWFQHHYLLLSCIVYRNYLKLLSGRMGPMI